LGLGFDKTRHQHSLFKLDVITYRDDPILPVSVPGSPWNTDANRERHTKSAVESEELFMFVRDRGFPALDVNAPLEIMGTWCSCQFDAAARTLGQTVFRRRSSMLTNRIVLCGSDIDIHDCTISYRPWRDVVGSARPSLSLTTCPASPDAVQVPRRRESSPATSSMSSWTACSRMENQGERTLHSVDFETGYPKHVRAWVLRNWESDAFALQAFVRLITGIDKQAAEDVSCAEHNGPSIERFRAPLPSSFCLLAVLAPDVWFLYRGHGGKEVPTKHNGCSLPWWIWIPALVVSLCPLRP
jgi:3-octaprenyl-4-hydroxybenzoate carboxy-lyase